MGMRPTWRGTSGDSLLPCRERYARDQVPIHWPCERRRGTRRQALGLRLNLGTIRGEQVSHAYAMRAQVLRPPPPSTTSSPWGLLLHIRAVERHGDNTPGKP